MRLPARLFGLAAAAVAGAWAPAAMAEDLTIAFASEATSMDPHFHNLSPNNQVAKHIYDRLVHQTPEQELVPALATEWGPTDDPLVWEFKLREGVTFHDGSPFTAEDVAFSIERAPNVPNSPSSFATYTADIASVEVVDDYTVRFHTNEPVPLMANNLSLVSIIPSENEGATTEQYNSGEAANGTGPYRQVEYVPGDRIVLEPNPDYWGEAPQWDRVTIRPIPADAARVAALLSGDVDVVEAVPTADIADLENNPNVVLSQGISNRVIYIHLDSDRETTPFITGVDSNPLLDQRVRQALSLAIDREALVEEVMEGVAIPAGQLLPDGFFGTSENIEVPEYDPEGARALLAEAGYPDGFQLTLHGPNGRYINDAEIAQAVAQMWSRIGVQSEVETMPPSVFFSRGSALEFSAMLVGWGSGTGESSSPLRSLIATHNPDLGWGASNRGRYSNPEFDELLTQALATVDEEARRELLAQATELAMEDVALIPTHFQVNTWGTRAGLHYIPRTDEETLAMGVVADD